MGNFKRAFRSDFFTESIDRIRLSLLVGFVLYAAFGILDAVIIPETRYTAWFVRYAIVCPVIIAIFIFSYSRHFKKLWEYVLCLLGIIAGVGIIVMIRLASPPGNHLYYAGLILVSTFYFTFFRFRFLIATFLIWTLFAFLHSKCG